MIDEILVALDLEATGMDPDRDQIIEIGAIKFRADEILDRYESMVRPSKRVPLAIRSLTGISNSELEHAPEFGSIAPRLRRFVDRSPIVGQSVEMDLAMLTGAGLGLGNPVYDTFELATILLPQLKSYDLGTIAAALEVSVPDRHRAVADAETSMLVFNQLVKRADEFDDATLERIARLLRQAKSPLSRLFFSIMNARRREFESLGGTTIGQQLLSKLVGSQQAGTEAMFLVARDRPRRLEPTGSTSSISIEALRQAMSATGPFAKAIPNFEVRDQQIEMMEAVASTLSIGGQSLIEAGTGTGKSLGYLVPAALHAVERGEPVVISTATIALQEQLINKDIPALIRAAEMESEANPESLISKLRHLNAIVLKGRANYLCLRQWFVTQHEGPRSEAESRLHAKIVAWLHVTETGDRAELRLTPEEQAHFSRLSEVEGSCLPSQCVFHRRNQCFLFRARYAAEASHLIIVNHSLLLSDLLRQGSVLPPFGRLVLDEAHHLEEEVTRQAGFRLTQSHISELFGRVTSSDDELGSAGILDQLFSGVAHADGTDAKKSAQYLESITSEAKSVIAVATRQLGSLFESLKEFAERYDRNSVGYERRVRVTTSMRNDPQWTQIEIEWDDVANQLSKLSGFIRSASPLIQELSEDQLPAKESMLTELELSEIELDVTRSRGYAVISASNDDLISWLSIHHTTGELALNAAPLHVSDLLRDELYRRTESITFTSATLSTEGNFDFVRERLGIDDADEFNVPSPFDYRNSTLLAVANDIPEPNQEGHQRSIQRALVEICSASQGRAMVLFTSHNALQTAYYAIRQPLEQEGIVVIGQRVDGSPRQLVGRLTDYPKTVLLGTSSFWEGVDIVGEALSLLVITRLPFSVPSDPIFGARSELFDNPFIEYAVPQAILRFKQGFGRLIRSSGDRGVCAVLDRRIVSRAYGKAFITSLPKTEYVEGTTSHLADRIGHWLNVETK